MNQHAIQIILIEDNPNDARLTMMALTESKISNTIVHLKDGAEALDYFFFTGVYKGRQVHDVPKLILLDLKMPKVNGIEVLKKLKENEETKSIPIAVFTSSQEDPDVKECYRLGVNSYIVKPLEFDSFAKVIADVGLYWSVINHLPQ